MEIAALERGRFPFMVELVNFGVSPGQIGRNW